MMDFFEKLRNILLDILRIACPPIHAALVSDYHERRRLKSCLGFAGGFALGMFYYNYILRNIPFPGHIGLMNVREKVEGSGSVVRAHCTILRQFRAAEFRTSCRTSGAVVAGAVMASASDGIGNAVSIQVRCISLLTVPMYCGKAGRGILKVLVLTFVIAGSVIITASNSPIANMGMNAREVVRVFACSTRLAYNVSRARYALMAEPFRKAVFGIDTEIAEVEDAFRSIHDVVAPIEAELEGSGEAGQGKEVNDYIDQAFGDSHRSDGIEDKYKVEKEDEEKDIYEKQYLKKVEYRCEDQLSRGAAICMEKFASAYDSCKKAMPWYASWLLCWPMRLTFVCNIVQVVGGAKICNSKAQIDPGLGEGYLYLKKAQSGLTKDFKEVRLQYRVSKVRDLVDVQDAKETGQRVIHAFEQKSAMMQSMITFVNVCVALLVLRIVMAAQDYHDRYLTSIEHDNVYITGYFKRIDARRDKKKKYILLPLKKMERRRYIDVISTRQVAAERKRLLTQALKVLLEVVTATTFVMLDRLFYEALDVVRHHAEVQYTQEGHHDVDIQVDGTGMVAGVVRRVLNRLNTRSRIRRTLTNEPCLPRARATPRIYYLHIYGGYLWILLLLYVDAYTIRLRRLICSYFYPKREKQRILHLYNDILKKRMKMRKTLRQKAAQSVRAHYLSGESLLSLRLKFPNLLGWLEAFPAARKKCLICGETQPKKVKCKFSKSLFRRRMKFRSHCSLKLYESFEFPPFQHGGYACARLLMKKPITAVLLLSNPSYTPCLRTLPKITAPVPRYSNQNVSPSVALTWYLCPTCPFVYCPECWRDCRVCFVCEGELDTDEESLSDNADGQS
ncbi:E3 ubiquitin-protein ligase DCST1 [Eumeta japonica]|uniref:E3 ubiquitin-protein ligase DCST1 n=1 Tax=Eumeta variegata TaxID=151549 RepID=A0A4C1VBG4_EUMVA|nr:E3 ubiquitin-protein ligase DCST1 [Eumeta japonica]